MRWNRGKWKKKEEEEERVEVEGFAEKIQFARNWKVKKNHISKLFS